MVVLGADIGEAGLSVNLAEGDVVVQNMTVISIVPVTSVPWASHPSPAPTGATNTPDRARP